VSASWLTDATPAPVQNLIRWAIDKVGEAERPLNSNRGRLIDTWNSEFGSPLGSFWCGNFVGYGCKYNQIAYPPVPGAVRNWRVWAIARGIWSTEPVEGGFVIYKHSHIGIIIRVVDKVLSVEGNTSDGGFDRNGNIVDCKGIKPDLVDGYIKPQVRGS
jgi:hypothetical protein